MFVGIIGRITTVGRAFALALCSWPFAPRPLHFALRSLLFALCPLLYAITILPSVKASDVGDFLGRRVTKVEVVIEGAPNSTVTEMKALLDVAPGQDYSPVRIHDSLLRLYRSRLLSGARVERRNDR